MAPLSHSGCGAKTRGRPAVTRLQIAHVVVTENFAGVERYVASVANRLASEADVRVIGGDPKRMPQELSACGWDPGGDVVTAARALRRLPARAVIHAHM